jgi:MinD superfamily P-loop ATPase
VQPVLRQLKRTLGKVVNRMGTGDRRVQALCRERTIPVLAEIPEDRRLTRRIRRAGCWLIPCPSFDDTSSEF